jgi:sulfide:quinone oxidoreductase
VTGTTLVLGGGVGGLVASAKLRKRLPRGHRVILVERQRDHVFAPSLLWIASGTRTSGAITKPLARLVHRGVEVVRGDIESIDPVQRRVRVGGQDLQADHIVVSLGADLAPDKIPGLSEGGFNLYTLEGAQAIQRAVVRMDGGRLVILTATPAYKCPAAPYEAAMLLESLLCKRGVRDRVDVAVWAAEPGPMGVTGPNNSAAVRAMVEAKRISYQPGEQVVRVDAKKKRIHFEGGAHADYDVLVYVPPHEAPKVVREAGLTDASGWVPVDRHTLATQHEGVWAIGDVTGIPLAVGKPLPKAGTFAHEQAKVVAHNIAHAVTGRGQPARFDGHGACFLEIGNGRAGFGSGDFYAEPTPQIRLRQPARRWHLGKVLFEKNWLRRH